MTESTAVVDWEAEVAKYAAVAVEEEASVQGGSWMSTQGGRLTYQENVIEGDKVSVIVAAAVHENQYYDLAWDPKKPRSPVCYAFGTNEAEMSPHPDCEAPQAEFCASCEKNKWPKEKGLPKPCKNVRRLALLPAGADMTAQDIAEADPAWLKVPVMSCKNWGAYVKAIGAFKKSYFSVITRVGIIPDKKSQFVLTFEKVADLPKELGIAAFARFNEILPNLGFPYRRNEETVEETKAGKAKDKARFK